MNSSLGQTFILLALLCAAAGAISGLVSGFRGSLDGSRATRKFALAFSGFAIAANLVMMWALWTDDFTVAYVAEVGSTTTPAYFKIPSLWASLHGSILFWLGILGLYIAVFAARERPEHAEYTPWALSTLLGTGIFFTLLVSSVANPFEAIHVQAGFDGPGPNPLLQNHWLMAFHPPMLYLGYVGMAVPFSMAVAALCAGRLDSGWMGPLQKWLMIPWVFLTIGIIMGGWWSYGVLGWGGYWAWDPVENASFHPWLTSTAAIHSALVSQRKGLFRTWTLVLIVTSFLLTLFGTFLTRSGVFNSVHAFSESNIGPVFLAAIAVVFVGSVLLLALRDHSLVSGATLEKRVTSFSLGSREFMVLLQNLLFAAFAFMMMAGTVFPLLAEAIDGTRLSVGGPWFDRYALPIGAMIVVLMGVGPALPWGRIAPEKAARRFVGPVIGGLAAGGASFAAGYSAPGTVLSIFVCGFALVANFGELSGPVLLRMKRRNESLPAALVTVLRKGRRRYAGHVAHLGVIMTVVAIALSKGYKVERDLTLRTGESATVAGYEVTFTGANMEQSSSQDTLIAAFALRHGDRDLGTYKPQLNYYKTRREPLGTPAVRSTPVADVYISLVSVEPQGAYASVRLIVMPAVWWIWASAPLFVLSTLLVLWPVKQRERHVRHLSEAA